MDETRNNLDAFLRSLDPNDTNEAPDLEMSAPTRLKSKIYSTLIRRMAESGPLQSIGETRKSHDLCVFEQVVDHTPLPEPMGSLNFCRVCHARILGERVEGAPIYWKHCPYVHFQNR